MHKCSECHRSYQTRASLKRHAHNHARNRGGHACVQCGITFARRDILNRHLQKSHSKTSSHVRRRCHTACESCRIARIKCDGSNPCQPCFAAQKDCSFPQYSQRVSRPVRTSDISTTTCVTEVPIAHDATPIIDEESSTIAVYQNGASDATLGALYDVGASDEAFTSPAVANGTYTDRENWIDDTCSREGEMNALPMDLDGIPWPWLHETLFLQDDPFGAPSLPDTSTNAEEQAQLSPSFTSHSPLEGRTLGYGTPSEVPRLERHTTRTRINCNLTVASEVDKVVDHATKVAFEMDITLERYTLWKDKTAGLACLLEDCENPQSSTSQSGNILCHFIEKYMAKFNPLWPMFSRDQFDPDVLHPILYLVLASIGSMYGSKHHKQFGTLMHKRLRRLLTAGLFDLEGCDGDLLWLAHARLLTQVQGLYFGQQQGFSYAQHLGAILVAQARRLNLFQLAKPAPGFANLSSDYVANSELLRWKQMEMRIRLAFGIVRADVFTSVLLNTRPLVSHEEVELPLPCSNSLWHNTDRMSTLEYLASIRAERKSHFQIFYCDLLKIFLERQESKPVLHGAGYELCLFGVQAAVWQFAHGQHVLERLTGVDWQNSYRSFPSANVDYSSIRDDESSRVERSHAPTAGHESSSSGLDLISQASSAQLDRYLGDPDTLGRVYRLMNDTKADRARVECALEACSQGLLGVRRLASTTQQRDTLMSSMLLLHTSYMELNTPLQHLHHISYRAANNHTVNKDILKDVQAWAESEAALRSAQKATAICEMIDLEQKRPPENRARFNFLAFVSVHHAAVVLWTISELRSNGGPLTSIPPEHRSTFEIGLRNRDTRGLLQACAQIFYHLSSLGGASFGAAAESLSRCTLNDVVTDSLDSD